MRFKELEKRLADLEHEVAALRAERQGQSTLPVGQLLDIKILARDIARRGKAAMLDYRRATGG